MLKSFTSIFLKPEEDGKPAAPAAPARSASEAAPVSVSFIADPPASPLDPSSEGKFTEKLGKAIEDANVSGIDFYEFMKSLEAITPLIPDEMTRYRAALGTLVAQGAKQEYILQTAQHYLDLLDEKERSFQAHISARTDETVTKKIAQADGIKEQIKARSEQINALSKEIGTLTQNEMAARNEATLARAEIEATLQTFAAVKARYVKMITTTRDKLAQFGLDKA